jgi:hypothetical protein
MASEAAEAVARQRALAAFEPQPELLPLPELGLPQTVELVALQERRRVGRPAGARNRRAEDVAREVIERLGDPLVMLASLAMTPIDELRAAGLGLAEAVTEKRLAAIAVLPYLHQRKPLAVDLTNRQAVSLTLIIGDAPAGEAVEFTDAEIVEIQQLSEVPGDAV